MHTSTYVIGNDITIINHSFELTINQKRDTQSQKATHTWCAFHFLSVNSDIEWGDLAINQQEGTMHDR